MHPTLHAPALGPLSTTADQVQAMSAIDEDEVSFSSSDDNSDMCSSDGHDQDADDSTIPCLCHLTASLTDLYGEAARSHVILGAVAFQKGRYCRATDHYRRSIECLVKQEEWTRSASSSSSPSTSSTSPHQKSDSANSTHSASAKDATRKCSCHHTDVVNSCETPDQVTATCNDLIEEHCRMDTYNQALLLENAADLSIVEPSSSYKITNCDGKLRPDQHSQESSSSHSPQEREQRQLLTATTSSTSATTGRRSNRTLRRRREPFYINQSYHIHVLDSNLISHGLSSTPLPREVAYPLSSAFILYNLSLCHCTLGAFDESMELLDMAMDVVLQNDNVSRYVPRELKEALRENAHYIAGIIQDVSMGGQVLGREGQQNSCAAVDSSFDDAQDDSKAAAAA